MRYGKKFENVLNNMSKEMYGINYNELSSSEKGEVKIRAYNAGYRPDTIKRMF